MSNDSADFNRTENPPPPQCSSRQCPRQAVGTGPVSGLALCSQHLERDLARASELQARLLRNLRLLREPEERQLALSREFDALAVQLASVQQTFDSIRDSIEKFSDNVVSQLQRAQDSIARKLSDTREAMDCERELTAAATSDADRHRTMEKLKSTELWLEEATERSTEYRRTRGSTNHLLAGVNQLKQLIDRSIEDVIASPTSMQMAATTVAVRENLTTSQIVPSPQPLYPVINTATPSLSLQHTQQPSAPPPPSSQPVCRLVNSIDTLPSEPHHVTVCTNTTGFVSDSNNRLIKASTALASSELLQQHRPLPQPSIFVSFLPECVDYLLVTSLNGQTNIRFHSSIDWQVWINGLHCDNQRQMLFIAQANAVTLTSLCGEPIRVISGRSLGVSVDWISSIAVTDNQLCVLDIGSNVILCVDRDSGKLNSLIQGDSNGKDFCAMHELALHEDQLLVVTKNGQINRLNLSHPGIYPGSQSAGVSFNRPPWKFAVDSVGQLLFASDPHDNTVYAVSTASSSVRAPDGVTQQSPHSKLTDSTGADAAPSLVRPIGLAVFQLQTESSRRLVVADSAQMRLFVYEIF